MKLQTSFEFANAKMLMNKLSKTASKLIVQKLRNMNLFMSLAFFPLLFSNLIYTNFENALFFLIRENVHNPSKLHLLNVTVAVKYSVRAIAIEIDDHFRLQRRRP